MEVHAILKKTKKDAFRPLTPRQSTKVVPPGLFQTYKMRDIEFGFECRKFSVLLNGKIPCLFEGAKFYYEEM